jgi:hypothetical protein
MPYPFFFSYARSDARINPTPPQPDPHFETFLARLTMRVEQLTGARGFVDRNDILTGQDLPDELAEALRTGKTMVCLYSPSYFLSDYCGKEMQILLERRKCYMRTHAGKKPANIIPVLWHPVPRKIPWTLPDIQYQAPDLDPKTQGVWNLGDMGKDRELMDFADQIAVRVRDAADATPLPPLNDRPTMGAIRSAFLPPPLPLPEFDSREAAAGPNAVTFVYASSKQWNEWPWAPPSTQAVLHLSAAVAKGREMEPNQLAFAAADVNLVQRLEVARHQNNVLILLVDGASLAIDGLRERLREYDGQQDSRLATVVIWNDNRDPDLERHMNETFTYFVKRAAPFFHSIDSMIKFFDLDVSPA